MSNTPLLIETEMACYFKPEGIFLSWVEAPSVSVKATLIYSLFINVKLSLTLKREIKPRGQQEVEQM